MKIDWRRFECEIMDICYKEKIGNVKELTNISDVIHQHVEIALMDYADDENIDGYIPVI